MQEVNDLRTDLMPDPAFAAKRGWTHQLVWRDSTGNPCFVRRTIEGKEYLEREADRLRADGLEAHVVEIPR